MTDSPVDHHQDPEPSIDQRHQTRCPRGARVSGQFGVGPHTDDHEDEIHGARDGFFAARGGDRQRAALGSGDRGDGGVGENLDVVALQFGVHEASEFMIHGRQHFRQGFDLGDRDSAGDENLGHLQADVAGADDGRCLRVSRGEGFHDGEGVAH